MADLVCDTRGLIDQPCADCGSTVFYVGAMSLLCVLCIDRRHRARVPRDGPITPISEEP